MFSLEGKVAVVTGAASGFGKATSLRFSEAGAKVVLADINDAAGVAEEAGGIYVETDVSKEEQVKAMLQKAVDEFAAERGYKVQVASRRIWWFVKR